MRFDHALFAGSEVPPFYDSMLGKLIAHAPTRAAAIEQLAAALDRTVCSACRPIARFLAGCLRHPGFARGAGDDRFPRDGVRRRQRALRRRAVGLEALAAAPPALLPREHLPPLWRGWSSSPAVACSVPLVVGGQPRPGR